MAAAYSDVTFYVGHTADGQIALTTTPPDGFIWGPVQTLRVTGPDLVAAPKPPLSPQRFTDWQKSLQAAGFAVEMHPL